MVAEWEETLDSGYKAPPGSVDAVLAHRKRLENVLEIGLLQLVKNPAPGTAEKAAVSRCPRPIQVPAGQVRPASEARSQNQQAVVGSAQAHS